MSGKKTKADLSALFKLEFYRKQNNWKFCSQVHQKDKKLGDKKAPPKDKTKASPTTQQVNQSDKKVLNKTYHVKATGNYERSVLNDAFLESDNDKNISSTQNSPVALANNWSPEFVKSSDNWAPKDAQTEIPCPEISKSHPENDLPELDLNLPERDLNLPEQNLNLPELDLNLPEQCLNSIQNGGEKPDYNSYNQKWPQDEEREQNWPYQTPENWEHNVNEDQNLPDDHIMHQETEFDPNWLQQQIKNCRQNCFNRKPNYYYQKDPEIIKNCTQNKSNEKYQEINNTPSCDWPKADKLPENIFEKWQEWKETKISPDVLQNWPEDVWQNDMMWQDCQCVDLPEMDKEGYEGTEARWPQETQIWTNNKLISDAVWSEDVLRELEFLNASVLEPELPAACEKWVPPDRLLQWMLANKECCDDVLETSCESEEQFMRAAHCAPHSSEVDIKPQITEFETSEWECGELITGAVGALSEGALLAAGRAHARALRRVARELRNREQGAPGKLAITAAPYDISCEEYPTRDIGLYQPTFIDTFISGSHKNNPNNKLLDIPQEKVLDLNANYNQLCSDAGRIVVDRVDRQIKVSRGTGLDKNQIGINMGQTGKNVGQTGINLGQTGVNMGQTGVNIGHTGVNIGQTGANIGHTGVNIGHTGVNMGHTGVNIGQTGANIGHTGVNIGQTGANIGHTGVNIGHTGVNMGHTGVNIGQTGVNFFTPIGPTGENMAPAGLDRDQMDLNYVRFNRYQTDSIGLRGQPSSFGDYNVIGRGRGRLPLMENQIVVGRGRGRNLDKNIFALN